MKRLTMIALFAGFLTVSLNSCRDQKTTEQQMVEDMQDQGADVKVKDDKIKMETSDKKLKIKKEDDGDVKIKKKDKN